MTIKRQSFAVVLMSGGMDSAVCTAIADAQGYEIAGLHLNYGQRTQKRELQAFQDIVAHYKIRQTLVVDVSHFAQIGGSSLTDTHIKVSEANLHTTIIPTSYVPFRNANILAIATSWAEVLGATALFIGAVEEDGSGYPDCRKEFFEAFQQVINTGTRPETSITIYTPLISLSKKEIVQKGVQLNAPFHLTWSCYQHESLACGVCDSCALRLRGFSGAGIDDPIPYHQSVVV